MFGINDNNSQKSDTNSGAAADAPAPTPDNPFGDNPASGMPEPKESSSAASSAPVLQDDTPTAAPSDSAKPAPDDDNLLDLKQQALRSLQPLVSHLDQSPEEKFKTTMMLIQATDNSSLVGQAYEAANQISDEKSRAQALLDVVNEINYFTQHSNGDSSKKV
jgi:hypothetical protein